MAEPFLGQIIMFAGNFAPRGWAFCEGQLLPISQNTALFSLLGTAYGGDGRTTFALPDLRGRVPIHAGQGPGLSHYNLGQQGGVEQVNLNTSNLPTHSHAATATTKAQSGGGDSASPKDAVWAQDGAVGAQSYSTSAPNSAMRSDAVEVSVQDAGGGQAHENRQPYLAINYIIALEGLFPSRS